MSYLFLQVISELNGKDINEVMNAGNEECVQYVVDVVF